MPSAKEEDVEVLMARGMERGRRPTVVSVCVVVVVCSLTREAGRVWKVVRRLSVGWGLGFG